MMTTTRFQNDRDARGVPLCPACHGPIAATDTVVANGVYLLHEQCLSCAPGQETRRA